MDGLDDADFHHLARVATIRQNLEPPIQGTKDYTPRLIPHLDYPKTNLLKGGSQKPIRSLIALIIKYSSREPYNRQRDILPKMAISLLLMNPLIRSRSSFSTALGVTFFVKYAFWPESASGHCVHHRRGDRIFLFQKRGERWAEKWGGVAEIAATKLVWRELSKPIPQDQSLIYFFSRSISSRLMFFFFKRSSV